MVSLWSRRSLLRFASVVFPISAMDPLHLLGLDGLNSANAGVASLNSAGSNDENHTASITDGFPSQPPELVREMVLVAHFNLVRVRELVEARPSLAKASWDWGFGDWESALGAASHVGNKPIAEYLISKGARPSLFSATMLGHLEVVKAFITAQPGVQRIRGPHSISLLAHARAWTRKGTTGRGLVHLGDHTFHPIGAAAVRIRFAEDPGGMVMTIHDPDLVLTARKKAEAKRG